MGTTSADNTGTEWRLAGPTALSMARTVVDAAGAAVVPILIARRLGVESLGAYAYAATICGLIYSLFSLSVTPIMVRRIASRQTRLRDATSHALQVRLFLVLPAGSLAIALLAQVLPMSEETRRVTAILGIGVGLGFIADQLFGVFQATGRFALPLIVTCAYRVGVLLAVIAVTGLGYGMVTVALSIALLQFGQAALSFVLVVWVVTGVNWAPNPSAWWALIREAAPLALVSLSETTSNRRDSLILGLLRPTRDVGIYAAANNFYIGVVLLVAAMQSAALPGLSEIGGPSLRARWLRVLLGTLTVSVCAASAMVIAPHWLITLLYGSEMSEAAGPLRILALAAVLVSTRLAISTLMIARRAQGVLAAASVAGAVVNIGLNVTLIPSWSVQGAALSTLASEALVLTIVSWRLWSRGFADHYEQGQAVPA